MTRGVNYTMGRKQSTEIQKYFLKNSRKKQFLSFRLCAILSSAMKSRAVLLGCEWSLCPAFPRCICCLPVSHLAVLVIRSTVLVSVAVFKDPLLYWETQSARVVTPIVMPAFQIHQENLYGLLSSEKVRIMLLITVYCFSDPIFLYVILVTLS